MVSHGPYAARGYVVRVIPFEGKWCVARGAGYYAIPVEKDEAIEWAKSLALEESFTEIAVCDEQGRVLEVVSVLVSASPTS